MVLGGGGILLTPSTLPWQGNRGVTSAVAVQRLELLAHLVLLPRREVTEREPAAGGIPRALSVRRRGLLLLLLLLGGKACVGDVRPARSRRRLGSGELNDSKVIHFDQISGLHNLVACVVGLFFFPKLQRCQSRACSG